MFDSTKVRANIAVDDPNPSDNYNLRDCLDEFKRLYERYGAKFNLFIPVFYHRRWPITDRACEWIKWVSSFPFFEVSAHGYYHRTPLHKKDAPSENEFLFVDGIAAEKRFEKMFELWRAANINPRVFRFPGWDASPHAVTVALREFDVIMGHPEKNVGPLYNWKGKARVINEFDLIHEPHREKQCYFWHSHIYGNHENALMKEGGIFSQNWETLENKIKKERPEFFFLSELSEKS